MPLPIRRANPLLSRFIGINLILILGLGWLGWRLVDQDRELERQRSRERLESSADAIASGLQRGIASIGDTLAGLIADENAARQVAPRIASSLPGDAVLVLATMEELESFPRKRLLYEPALPLSSGPAAAVFARGDSLEFHRRDPEAAAIEYRSLVKTSDPSVRAGALLRVGRASRKARSIPVALAAYDEMERLDNGFVDGVPARLVAGAARIALWRETGDTARLRRTAADLHEALHDARWRVPRAVFEFYDGELSRELGLKAFPHDDDQLATRAALSDAAESFWSSWHEAGNESWPATGTRTVQFHGRHLLVSWESRGDRLAALIGGPTFLSENVLPGLATVVDRQRVRFELTDQNSLAVLESSPSRGAATRSAASAPRVSRGVSETGLPWALLVSDLAGEPGNRLTAGRQPLLIAGLIVAAFLALSGTWAVSRATNRELNAARLQSEFVSAVSHEFRSPLTSLRQLTELLASGRVSSPDRRQEYYETIRRETARLNRFVESLLDFSRRDAGFAERVATPVDGAALIRDTIDEYSREPVAEGYTIELAPTQGPTVVTGDAEALKRAFWNLLDNAVKYSPDARHITVELSSTGAAFVVRVIDRGMGIPIDEQRSVFEKFRRGVAARELGIRGTGIGLAMVSQIVESHGGTVAVESTPGEGSIFTVSLPLIDPAATAAAAGQV